MDRDWIIITYDTGSEFTSIYRFFGNDTDVKQKLCNLVTKDRKMHEDIWDYGCEAIEDVIETRNGHEYQASAIYSDHRIDYTAREFTSIEFAS